MKYHIKSNKCLSACGNILSLAAAFISSFACSLFFNLTTSNIFALVFFIFFYWLSLEAGKINDKRIKICSIILGLFFAGALVLGSLSNILILATKLSKIKHIAAYSIGFFILFKNLVAVIYHRIFNYSALTENYKYTKKKAILFYFIAMAIMLLCWLPYFLKEFPAVITSDSNSQLKMAMGLEPLINHHPLAHTFMIKVFYELGLLLFKGNVTLAIATYSVCQAVLLSAAFSFIIVTFYKFNIKKIFIFLTLAFYALAPYNGLYSITMWKDVWFAGIVPVLCVVIWRLIEHYKIKQKKLPVFELIMFAVFALMMCLFRSNGWYAYIVFAPCIFFFFRKKSMVVSVLALAIIPLAFIIKGPIYKSLDVIQPDTIESLSIPAQHIARAISDGAELTDEQYNLLSEVVDVEKIPERYYKYISDSIKGLVREKNNQEFIANNKLKFLKLWVEIGLENPRSYILAQIDQTYGYWYPDVQYCVIAEDYYNVGLDTERNSFFSDEAYQKFTDYMFSYTRTPLYGLLWSIGTFTWAFAFLMILCFLKREKIYLLLFIPLFAIIATLMIATPVFAEFRYIYSLFTTMPLFIGVTFATKGSNKEIEVGIDDTVMSDQEKKEI